MTSNEKVNSSSGLTPAATSDSTRTPESITSGPVTLKSARVWDITSPAPVNSVMGHFVPKPLKGFHRERRISVETYQVPPAVEQKISSGNQTSNSDKKSFSKKKDGIDENEQVFVRILVPATTKEAKAARAAAGRAKKDINRIAAALHIGRDASSNEGKDTHHKHHVTADCDSDDDDDASYSDTTNIDDHNFPAEFLPPITEEDSSTDASLTKRPSEWICKYRFPLSDVTVNKRVNQACVLTTMYKKTPQTREIIFRAEKDAKQFFDYIEHQKGLDEERKKKRFKAALGGLKLKNPDDKLDFLIEIVSGIDLPAADFASSDPFVIVELGRKEIHRTKSVPNSLDPIWTLQTKSLFILSTTAKELFDHDDGLTFIVVDYDFAGDNETLGVAMVPPRQIFAGNEERVEYTLKALPGKKDYGKGRLAIRVRRATDYDKDFISKFESGTKSSYSAVIDKFTVPIAGMGGLKSLTERKVRTIHNDKGKSIKQFRVRPGPDPKHKTDTEWLTKDEVQAEALKPSHQWLDIGSGKLGRIYVEIIGCNGLPNLDSGGILGNTTDPFVQVVYEDSFSATDVIDDTVSPRWPPWSQRAFIFHIQHPSSEIFVGVFDYDAGNVNDNDLIGRVSVNVSSFRPNTSYLLDYNLYKTAQMSNRKTCGHITIRLRVEIDNERHLLLSNLEPPPVEYINVQKKKDFRSVRTTIQGKYNMEKYSTKTISALVEELLAYQIVLMFITDACVAVLLWRGHFPVKLRVPVKLTKSCNNDPPIDEGLSYWKRHTKEVSTLLPIHSISAFVAMTMIVERPSLMPSFFAASIAWLLIAVLEYRHRHPSPWSRCRSFAEFAQILVIGHCTTPLPFVEKYQNVTEAEEFQKMWDKRIKDAEEKAEQDRQAAVREQEEYEREMEEIGDTNTDIATKSEGPSFDPMKFVLFPIQQYLNIICDCLRFTKNVIVWEECYFAFWICIGSLTLAVAFLFVPWAFITRWLSRIVVWIVFGPWMKAVDIFWYSKYEELTDEEKKVAKEKARHDRKKAKDIMVQEARINREDAAKLKDMKTFMFGKFITKVPVLKMERFRDTPLPSSSATPHKQKPLTMAELSMKEAGLGRIRQKGQHLVGKMIPRLETLPATEAPTGQPTAHPSLLNRNDPGSFIRSDSTTEAVAKLGSIVIVAGVITWFGVPLLIGGLKYFFSGSIFDRT